MDRHRAALGGRRSFLQKAHVAKVRSNIEAKMDEQDAKAAALDADLAEDYALDAISFAQGAIEEAEAASLDAVYARANAVAPPDCRP